MISVAQRIGLASTLLLFSCIQLSASPQPPNTPDLAVKKALPLLQRTAKSWFQGARCSSCHHQSLAQVTVAVAREQGYLVEDKKAKEIDDRLVSGRIRARLALFEGTGDINGSAGNSYGLFGLSAARIPANDATDSQIYYLLSKQAIDGRWPCISHRPPLEDKAISLTALALRALAIYTPRNLESESREAQKNGRTWLLSSQPKSTEERTFKLLGLSWVHAPKAELIKVRDEILATQCPDGGWSQLPSLKSDAYATGQVLVALQTAGGVRANHESIQRGIHFLLETQKDDGSWLVETRRRFPGLPYFESGFPHREHQFISSAGTAWSTMALAIHRTPGWQRTILDTQPLPRNNMPQILARNAKDNRLMNAALFGSVTEIERAIKGGGNVNSVGIEGTTALMYAARDSKKVALLLERGAKVKSVSNEKTTALHVASGFVRGGDSVRLQVKAGANIDVVNAMGETPLALAANSGDMVRAKFLLDNGANPNSGGAIAGIYALSVQNVPMLKLLIDRGLDLKTRVTPQGDTLLSFCVQDGSEDIIQLLLENGANPNDSTKDGLTILMTAAMCDPGHARIVENLIRHGARVDAKTPEGKTALSLATKYHNLHLARAIDAKL